MSEEAQHERLGSDHGAVEVSLLQAENRVGATKAKQIAVQQVRRSMPFALFRFQLAALEGLQLARLGQAHLHLLGGEARKLRKKSRASPLHLRAKRPAMIGKVQERTGRPELLSLKQHWRPGKQEQQRGHRAHSSRARQPVNAFATPR